MILFDIAWQYVSAIKSINDTRIWNPNKVICSFGNGPKGIKEINVL